MVLLKMELTAIPLLAIRPFLPRIMLQYVMEYRKLMEETVDNAKHAIHNLKTTILHYHV